MRTHRPVGHAPASGRLTVSGPYFVDATGAVVIRRSVTAFTLPKRFAEGRIDEARAFMAWAARTGFDELRVFTRVDWTGPPHSGVETGWHYDQGACEAMLEEAAALGLRVEPVALTYDSDVAEMADHLRRVDEFCLRHENAILEVANEPAVNSIDVPAVVSRYWPRSPGWSTGQYDPLPAPGGESLTYHSPRKDAWARCFKDAWEIHEGAGPAYPFSPPFRGPVMLDEPPQVEQTIRDQGHWPADDDWRAYGAGCAFFAAGGTMHGHPTMQRCEVPTDPAVLACCDAFIAGFADVPVQRYQRYDRGAPPTPSDEGSRRYWRWNEAGKKYEICVRPYSFREV
jgi:hypothetical protein